MTYNRLAILAPPLTAAISVGSFMIVCELEHMSRPKAEEKLEYGLVP